MKIWPIGGAGYIGSMLVPLLIEKGYKVTVYDMFNYGAESLISCTFSPNLTLIKGDIKVLKLMSKRLEV